MSEDNFREFEDRSYADWKRIRAVLEHENLLIFHRQTWLMNSQAFLFAAFAAIFVEFAKQPLPSQGTAGEFKAEFVVLCLLCALGLVISVFIGAAIRQAETQHMKLCAWWKTSRAKAVARVIQGKDTDVADAAKQTEIDQHPEIAGDINGFVRPGNLHFVFDVAWVVACTIVILNYFHLIK